MYTMSALKEIKQVNISESEKTLIEKGWSADVANNVIISRVLYNSEGYLVDGYIAEPKSSETKRYPLILWNRGGDEKNGRLDDFLASGILGEIASWGYLVVASQYRQKDEFGGRDIGDILNILKIGMKMPAFDGENIGVEGWSRGGMMTYQLLTKLSFLKCAIVVAGLADLRSNFEKNSKLKDKFYGLFKGADEKKILEEIGKRSAVDFFESIRPEVPLLMIHGTADDKVSYQDSVQMYKKLSEYIRAELRLETIENGDHYLRKERNTVRKLRRDWFYKYLKLNK